MTFLTSKLNWSVILLICISGILVIRIISDLGLGGDNSASILPRLNLTPAQVAEIRELKQTYQPELSRYRERLLLKRDRLNNQLQRELAQKFLDDYFALQQLQFTVSFEIHSKLNSQQKEIFEDYFLSRLHRNFKIQN